ncbi:MAG: hypothetical protein OK454_05620 [Thaumarchaeota archaeon]|nr:hypothetical protein [Nitrososphaerota archaeon]
MAPRSTCLTHSRTPVMAATAKPLLQMILLLLLSPCVPFASADCYWADGSTDLDHDQCFSPSAGALGLCCATGDLCLDNGLCQGATGYYRGSCSYPDWSMGDCPNFCLDNGAGVHAVALQQCGGEGVVFVCDDGSDSQGFPACNDSAAVVTLPGSESTFATVGNAGGETSGTGSTVSSSACTTFPEPGYV